MQNNTADIEGPSKPNLTDKERRGIIDMLLKVSVDGHLPRGALSKCATKTGRHRSTIGAIWSRYVEADAAGVVGGEWGSRIKKSSGRKRKDRDEICAVLAAVSVEERGTERQAAAAAGISRHLVRAAIKEGVLKRKTTFIKPVLSEKQKLRRMKHVLSYVDDTTMRFEPMHDVVHMDEKWFNADHDKRSYLVVDGEEPPPRAHSSKRFITKIMFIAAVARPRFDPHRKSMWDGKLGIWALTEEYIAKKSSKNRPRGAVCIQNIPSIDRDVIKRYLLEHLIPAIKEKWPKKDRGRPIFIQQDNAKPHVPPNDRDILEAGLSGGWNIMLISQPANSPDMNVLDLGLFTALQTLQYRVRIRTVEELINAVNKAYEELTVETNENIFLTLQLCMLETLKAKGGNNYKLPHMGKAKLRRASMLPETVECGRNVYDSALRSLADGGILVDWFDTSSDYEVASSQNVNIA